MDLNREYRYLNSLAYTGIALFVGRCIMTWDIRFIFLNWNLFLGWLPLYFATRAVMTKSYASRSIMVLLWLLFLPNSFYIFTDLIHIQWSTGFWRTYDVLLILLYALASAGYGFMSIAILKDQLARYFKWLRLDLNRGIMALLLLCSFGVYMGRSGRLNSWDLFVDPLLVTEYITDVLQLNNANLPVFVFTGLFWLFLVLIYTALIRFSHKLITT